MPFELDFRPVPGFEGHYSVSNDGRIWSHKLSACGVEKGWLSPICANTGYLAVTLSVAGKTRRRLVHRLVALAWLSNPRPNVAGQVNHRDGQKHNNAPTNLEWCTGSENVQHAFATGLRVHSDAVKRSARAMGLASRALTAETVRAARQQIAAGASLSATARSLGINPSTMHSIVHRRTYRDII